MPPYSDIYGKINIKKMGFVMPSLGLAYIASFLKSKGEDVELVDAACIDDIDALFKKIGKERPRIIGFNVVTANMSSVVRMADEIKKIHPACLIVVGGPHPSALPGETVKYKSIDIVVFGEGEFTLWEVAQGKELSAIKGICYKEGQDIIKINEPRPLIEDLDDLPSPLFEGLPIERYGYLSLGRSLPVLSGRGCPHGCSFCASGVINKKRCRFRDVNKFVDELEFLKKNLKISKFIFCDESFTLDKKRTIRICEEILRRGLKIKWSCMMRVDNAEQNMLAVMKRAGCQMIEIGVESADESVLKKANKRIDLKQVIETVKMANKNKLEINAFFILGLPLETRDSIMKTISFAKKLRIDYAQFSMFIPLPGTQAWDWIREGKYLRCIAKDWDDFSRYKRPIVASKELPSEDLFSLYNKAIKDFYIRPYIVLRTLRNINSLEKLITIWKAGLCFLKIVDRGKE